MTDIGWSAYKAGYLQGAGKDQFVNAGEEEKVWLSYGEFLADLLEGIAEQKRRQWQNARGE